MLDDVEEATLPLDDEEDEVEEEVEDDVLDEVDTLPLDELEVDTFPLDEDDTLPDEVDDVLPDEKPPVDVEEPPVLVELDEPPEPPLLVEVDPPLEVEEITTLPPVDPPPPKKPPPKKPPPKPPKPPLPPMMTGPLLPLPVAGNEPMGGKGTGAPWLVMVTTAGGQLVRVCVTTRRIREAGRLTVVCTTRRTCVTWALRTVWTRSVTCTAPPPIMAPPQAHAHNFAMAIRTDMLSFSRLRVLSGHRQMIGRNATAIATRAKQSVKFNAVNQEFVTIAVLLPHCARRGMVNVPCRDDLAGRFPFRRTMAPARARPDQCRDQSSAATSVESGKIRPAPVVRLLVGGQRHGYRRNIMRRRHRAPGPGTACQGSGNGVCTEAGRRVR